MTALAHAPVRMPALPDQAGIDPDSITFTPGCLAHAERVGFTLDQMRAAVADPRWVNRVRQPLLGSPPLSSGALSVFSRGVSQPPITPRSHRGPTRVTSRLRYCGHGVAVVVAGHHAIAVIADDLAKQPPAVLVRGEQECGEPDAA